MAKGYDIVIIGGGMVGLAMAAAVADTGLTLAIVEKSSLEALTEGRFLATTTVNASQFESRVSAISPGNQAFLQSLAIWSRVPQNRRADYEWMRVWDGEGSGAIEFDAAELAQPFLGTIVENQVLRAAAYQCLLTYDNVEFITEDTISSVSSDKQSASVELSSGRILQAKLVIGADGALSSVRKKLGIASFDQPYQQTAFVANVETEIPHQNTAWQRFTHSGPVAFLPLPQPHLCSVVWTLDQAKAEAVKQQDNATFAKSLAQAFEYRLGEVKCVSPFAGFPLVKRHSETYLANRCVLIGDAAHTIHPLAGQGVNLGFQDVACLNKLIRRLSLQKRDFGLVANLRPYERERKAENYLMQNAMSSFKWLFSRQGMLLTLFRNSALSMVDHAGPLKQMIIRRAMGT